MNCERIWLSWEKQRRTLNLSKEFSAYLVIHESSRKGILRYIELFLKTHKTIKENRPKTLFVQNPSIFLATLACLLKPIYRYKLIIDRHTNFKLKHRDSINPKWLAFHCLSKLSNKYADAVIVTNRYLALLIKKQAKKVFVLPDKIPDLPEHKHVKPEDETMSALFICTYADDEPFREVFQAAAQLPDTRFYVTGKYQKALSKNEIQRLPSNVVLLGFIPDEEYFKTLSTVDFTIILTDQEFTLNCGSYESIAAGKPMLVSNTKTIRSYFERGAVYAHPKENDDLKSSIQYLIENIDELTRETNLFRKQLRSSWAQRMNKVVSFIQE